MTYWQIKIFEYEYARYSNILSSEHSEIFYRKFTYLLNNILENKKFVSHPRTRQQVKSEIIDLSDQFLLALDQHDQPIKISVRKARQVVNKVFDLIQENTNYCYSIDELCQITFTSRRTLQNCFELITGQSPALFLKTIKLNAVRRALHHANSKTSISDIASDWGFWHLSQFAMDYKRLFNESPSQTLQRHFTRAS